MERETVHHECVPEEVEVLAGVADAVRASEPERVFEIAVDGFGVVAAGIQPREVRIGRGDRSDVLRPVEPPGLIVGVAVESDGNGLRVGERARRSRRVRDWLAAVSVIQAAWRYSLISTPQVGCRRIGLPG